MKHIWKKDSWSISRIYQVGGDPAIPTSPLSSLSQASRKTFSVNLRLLFLARLLMARACSSESDRAW